ncbi:MAG: type IX secretion system membrane protein PorP/SprF [bacterium]
MILGLWANTVFAQAGFSLFQPEPTNIYDWRAAMVNPSLGALQSGAVEAGFKIFHLGFADAGASLFKAGYVVLNVPKRLPFELTAGLQTQFFHTPLYSENALRLALSRRVSPKFAIGAGFSVLGLSYNESQFNLVDTTDPVLAGSTSLWKPDVSLGLTFMPMRSVVIGVGVSHINRPSISLIGDDIHLEPALTIGFKYSIGPAEIHTGSTIDNISARRRASVQYTSERLGLVQIGIDNEAVSLLSRLNVSGAISVGYGMSFPVNEFSGNGAGSHEAAVIYEFDRIRKQIELVAVPDNWSPFKPEMARIRMVPQFITMAERNTVDIVTKTVTRDISPDIDSPAIRKLTDFDLGLADTMSIGTPLFLTNQFVPDDSNATGNLITLRGDRNLVFNRNFDFSLRDTTKTREDFYFVTDTSYFTFLKNLGKDLKDNPAKKTLIVTMNEQFNRAQLIIKYLSDSLHVPLTQFAVKIVPTDPVEKTASLIPQWDLQKITREEIIRLADPETITISVFPIDSSSHFRPWTVVVETQNGERIYTYKSISVDRQQQFQWDWRDSSGNIIEHGFYHYYVEWQDDAGRILRSAPRTIYARELRSRVHVKIAPEYGRLKE